jgi:ubiquinone/menaquinone biosynthesis C-methylase UbiE
MKGNTLSHNINIHDKIYKSYNIKHSEIYNDFEQERLNSVISDTINFLRKPTSQINVLDVGAGTGNLSLKYLDRGCKVTATDVSLKSLQQLKDLAKNKKNLYLNQITESTLNIPDNSFDVVCTYSVLHHIPDYILTIKEMIRVTKPNGIIYIDHEANKYKYNPTHTLKEYQKLTQQTILEHIIKLHKSKELYTYEFIKSAFIKTFINKKYQREGDIHVWADDHIEWSKIYKITKDLNCKIIKEVDYLMYRPKGGIELYNKYCNQCSDTKYVIIQK